jgi:hypothetical protein
VDQGLHHLQGKAERVTGLLLLLEDFYREKLAMLLRHQAGSRLVAQYDANNTYQYIVAREDVQLSWLSKALQELGSTPGPQAETPRTGAGRGVAAARRVQEEDAQDAQAFVDRWRPRLETMTNARHRGMLRVILGETLEQKRFFEQALAGRTDLLGRRGATLGPSAGEVLPSRWIE